MNVDEMDGDGSSGGSVREGGTRGTSGIQHTYISLLYIFKCVPGIKRVLWTVVLSIPPPPPPPPTLSFVSLLASVLACACACAVPRPRCVCISSDGSSDGPAATVAAERGAVIIIRSARMPRQKAVVNVAV